MVLWIILVAFSFQLQGYYLLWRSFPTLFIYDIASMLYVRNPNEVNFIGLACSAFARRYLRNRISFSSSGYLDVSVPRVSFSQAMYLPVDNCTLLQLSSLIRRSAGQSDICSLPQLFAACHVLLRLPVPRHPPCALLCLTNLSLAFSSLFCVAACSFVSYIHMYAPSSFARAPCLKWKILRDGCLH